MCQVYLASVSPECCWCGGGYLAGPGNHLSHNKDCPAVIGDEIKKREVLERRRKAEQETRGEYD